MTIYSKINTIKFSINEQGLVTLFDTWHRDGIFIDISVLKEIIKFYEKEFPKGE